MPDDRRDERLAARLEVEPLDELTRRRLVGRALEESAPVRSRPRWQPLAAAAAVVLVVVTGLAVLLSGGDDGNPPEQALRPSGTATADGDVEARSRAGDLPAPSSTPSTPSSPSAENSEGATSSAGGRATRNTAGGGSALGDFGDLSQRANRARAVEAVRDTRPGALALEDADAASGFAAASPVAGACVPAGAGPVVAHGTGTFAGRPALVLVTRADDGSVRARLVVAEPCEVRDLTS